MGRFEDDVRKIADELGIRGLDDRNDYGETLTPVSSKEIASAVGEVFGGQVNCYPGQPDAGCFPVAFFFSLKDPKKAKKRGHLSMEQALDYFIQHMTGPCEKYTQHAIIVTDNWDPKAFRKWEHQIRKIADQKNVEVYLIGIDRIVQRPV